MEEKDHMEEDQNIETSYNNIGTEPTLYSIEASDIILRRIHKKLLDTIPSMESMQREHHEHLEELAFIVNEIRFSRSHGV